MRAYVGVTDRNWYEFLRGRPDLDEVNFWQPSGGRTFRAIQAGEPFLFKLHYPDHAIVGGGTFTWSTSFPVSITWRHSGKRMARRLWQRCERGSNGTAVSAGVRTRTMLSDV
jgi:putative restriction endonuclease